MNAPSAHQRTQLERYAELLRSPGVDRGMIARGDVPRLWERHIGDSLRGAGAIPSGPRRACDLGSGGGLPGVVIAVVRPDVAFVLAERRRNRADFLALVRDELGLSNVEIHHGDVGMLPPGSFDICLARAFADPARTWAAAEPLLVAGGRLIYWAGASFDVAAAPRKALVTVFPEPEVAGSGPLVIMTRQ